MSALKNIMLSVAGATGAFTFSRWLTAGGARILAYHGVDHRFESLLNFDGFHVAPDIFHSHLRTLRGHYKVVSLRSLAECFRDGNKPPPRAVAITFDDGYVNNLAVAARMLGDFYMSATFFITTGFIDGTHRPWWFVLRDAIKRSLVTELAVSVDGRDLKFPLRFFEQRKNACIELERILKAMPAKGRDAMLAEIAASLHIEPAGNAYPMLTWDDVISLQEAGHEIGSHTVSHISLAHESRETVGAEVKASNTRIAEMTGREPVLFSYPYGEAAHFTDDIAKTVRDAGCIGGVTTVEGFNSVGTNPLLMRRVNVTGNHHRNEFRSLVSGLTMAVRR
jgi:peptidoglycan/xylan/chitin deacetylase (PgdA/CDA1 family)